MKKRDIKGKFIFTGSNQSCLICKNEFYVPTWRLGAKYCSHKCYSEARIGNTIPWNKGTKGLSPANKTSFRRGTIRPNPLPPKEYKFLHYWVNKVRGKAIECEHCHLVSLEGKRVQWANRSGKYLQEISDWVSLCVSCHSKYDERGFYARSVFQSASR
jgi:hypothetical protein